ncbi:MAG: prepilin-type N-terminal cleavage/methylation domain-containing protein [bacterium]
MKNIFAKNSSGFSLVELLVVIAITFIMTGVLFANDNKKKATADVESVARQIATQIRAVQNDALTGKRIGDEYAKTYTFSSYVTGYSTSYLNSGGADIGGGLAIDLSKKRVAITANNFSFISPFAYTSLGTITITSSLDGAVKMCVDVTTKGDVTERKC